MNKLPEEAESVEVSPVQELKPDSSRSHLLRALADIQIYEKLTSFSFNDPCKICGGIEGCSHSIKERYDATRPQPSHIDQELLEALEGLIADKNFSHEARGIWLQANAAELLAALTQHAGD